eukprot:CAMPEP_0195593150 /NCGR_PEP_ID=MMETSP0815-20121206/732_1 /TAXON_ID=97485 /ORGANISM="Prymnesium parvum, Strain Texoma1" /LENGTH=86 /DNA_ID=CAMNT_0040732273 /DNA_START=549 /DNA_END=809 /DNA_ORIENTATION=-
MARKKAQISCFACSTLAEGSTLAKICSNSSSVAGITSRPRSASAFVGKGVVSTAPSYDVPSASAPALEGPAPSEELAPAWPRTSFW